MILKKLAVLIPTLALLLLQAPSAFACGGLVAPDGDVRLSKATTFVAWHNGIERYLTSFAYQGNVSNVGWIVPLPAVPLKIEQGGAWTLQRLERETHPIVFDTAAGVAAAPSSVDVLQQVKIEALNITVVRGNGDAVITWALRNGFSLNQDTRDHLIAYAKGSPIFMAAKYDTAAAQARGQLQGDGAPILITMQVPHLWVPLEVLALDGQQVQADLYLLTDQPLYRTDVDAHIGQSAVGSDLPGAPGFTVQYQQKMNPTLYHDLSTDRNMNWVWQDSWLTYLSLDAPSSSVTYDLGVTSTGVMQLAPFGTPPMAVADTTRSQELPSWLPHFPLGTPQVALYIAIFLAVAGFFFWVFRGRAGSKAKA